MQLSAFVVRYGQHLYLTHREIAADDCAMHFTTDISRAARYTADQAERVRDDCILKAHLEPAMLAIDDLES